MQNTHIIALGGGLDITTPQMQKRDGVMAGGRNYEPDVAGYRRMIGWERLDGRSKPHLASFWVVNVTGATSTPTTGDVVTGETSGATGTMLIDGVIDSGTGYLVLRDVTGTFTDGENLQVSAMTVAQADGDSELSGAATSQQSQQWAGLAADSRRASITAVPGSGDVRGVVGFNGKVYAIRDNVGGTAGVLHEATASGWAAVDLGSYIAFGTGTDLSSPEPLDGDTVTGATSKATATAERIVLNDGAWGSSDAAGFLHLSNISGTFQGGETLEFTTAGGTAIAVGVAVANSLPPGGQYEFVDHNFFGAATSRRLYGTGGVGPAFEFDGTVFAPIFTGLETADEIPAFIAEYQNRLFIGYRAGSWLYSELGFPLSWNGALGAGEIAVGDEITGAVPAASVLTLYAKKRVDYLSGRTAAEFTLNPVSRDSGAQPYTAQQVDQPIYMDTGAIRSLSQTEALGGWRMGALSRLIEPYFDRLRENAVTPTASMRVRQRDLYRVFLSDKSGITIYLGRGQPECAIFETPERVSCAYSGNDVDDFETLLVGCADGFVYEMDVGTTWDGDPVEAWCRLNFTHMGRPFQKKKIKHVSCEVDIPGYATLSTTVEVDFGDPSKPTRLDQTTNSAGGGFWDDARWNTFNWDATIVGLARSRVNAVGRNFSVGFYHLGENAEPFHVLQNATLFWMERGLDRRSQ
ncbi:MAG: hypothetical protein AAGD08_15980 [Pseudomonadota bacterium]